MEHILGQPRAIDLLQSQLAADRVHHAYIFHGPAGVGKFTTAVAFARLLLCHDRQTDLTGAVRACGGCPSCRLLPPPSGEPGDEPADDTEPEALGVAHPDLHVVSKELARYSEDRATRDRKLTQIPVEVLRSALIGPAYRGARLDHGKVFIVDEAELLNPAGQNALLKTLEEPPAGTHIILVTASEDRLLPTIRSRCQRIAFAPLPEEVVASYLERAGADLRPSVREQLVRFAGGSLGRAQLAVRYDLGEWAQTLGAMVDQLASGAPAPELGEALAGRIDALAKAWVDRHANASKEAANKLAAQLASAMLTAFARDRLASIAEALDPADPEAADAVVGPWLALIDAVERAMARLGSNVNLSLVCDALSAEIATAFEAGAAGSIR